MTGGCATNKSILFRKPLAVGKNSWLRAFCRHLKEYRRTVYLNLLMSGRLNSYLADNALEWVGRVNNIQACAREIVDKEIIYQ